MSTIRASIMEAKQGYGWIHLAGVAYCVIVGIYSVLAWVDDGKATEALVCAGAQLLAIVFAILGRRAFNGDVSGSGLLCVAISGGCAWWASQGIAHAWARESQSATPEGMVWLLAALEPALFLLAEHIQSANVKKATDKARNDAEAAEALAAARRRDDEEAARRHEIKMAELAAQSPNVTRLKPRQKATKTAAAVVAASLASGHATAATPSVDTPMVDTTKTALAHAGENAKVAEACRLRDRGMTQVEVADAMGCSTRSVSRYWQIASKAGQLGRPLTGAPERRYG